MLVGVLRGVVIFLADLVREITVAGNLVANQGPLRVTSIDVVIGDTRSIASGDWGWARCDAGNPFPGTPVPDQICLRDGFDPRVRV